jgi:hypothetical protein
MISATYIEHEYEYNIDRIENDVVVVEIYDKCHNKIKMVDST